MTRKEIMQKNNWLSRNTFNYWRKKGKIKMVTKIMVPLYIEVDTKNPPGMEG